MFSKAIIHTHVFVPVDELGPDRIGRLREKLTVVSRYDRSEFPTFLETPTMFGIPLYYTTRWTDLAREISDTRLDGSKIKYDFLSEMRPGQIPVLKMFKKQLDSGVTGFVVDAPPGFGKTVVMIKMIQMIGRSAIVVVPRSNLVEQWVSRIAQHTSLKRSEIGIVNGKEVNWEKKRIVVGLVHSLAARLNDNRRFRENFGIAVFDEVDRSVPPATFSPVLCMFPARYRIGASATVTRKDGLHLINEYHIGQTLIRGGDHGRMNPKVLVIDYPESSGYVHPGSTKINRRGMLLSRLSTNQDRNRILCKYIHLISESDRRVLVLSDRTQQLVDLRRMLILDFGYDLDTVGFYCDTVPEGKTKRKVRPSELRHSAHVCKVVLATYGKAGIGTDIADLAGLVYATPQSDVRQTQGRIERLLEGKSQPVVVDIVDSYYDDAVGWSRSRLRYYQGKTLKMKQITEK
jgi:superfamily II DNA or RNA helicase